VDDGLPVARAAWASVMAGGRGGPSASGISGMWRPVLASPSEIGAALMSWRAVNSPSKLTEGRGGGGAPGKEGEGAVEVDGAPPASLGLGVDPDISMRSTKSPT
jgi:hypothetical protein